MDRYKKTSLKFDKNLGYGRNLRTVEINNSRAVARNSRFSMQRCLEDEVEESENQPKSKIASLATFGKQTLKAPVTRLEMLQKWKEEKLMQRKMESKNKKPTFKIGLVPPKSIPVFTTFNRTDSRISSMKDSKCSYNVTNSSKMMKETFPKPQLSGKSQTLSSNSMKPLKSKEFQIQSANLKPPSTQYINSKVKKEPHLQVPNKPKIGLQKPSFISSKQIKNEEVQAPVKSQVVQNKVSFTATKAKSKMQPLSALPKATESRIFKKPEPVQLNSIPGRNQNRIPEPKANQLQNSGRTLLKGPSKTAQTKQTGIPNKTAMKPKQKVVCPKKNEEPSDSNITFSCEISHIEPAEEPKSFAPKGFLFNPGAELSFSFLEEGPMAVYFKLKAGEERTSTPKRKELKEIQEEEAAKCSNTKDCPENKPVSEIPEILDTTTNTSFHQTPCSPQMKLSEEVRPISVPATSVDAVKDQKSGVLDDVSNISKESKVNRSCETSCDAIKTSPEGKTIEENSKSQNSVTNLPDGLSVIEESPIPSFVTASASSLADDPKENTFVDVFINNPKVSDFESFEENRNGCTTTPDDLLNRVDLVSSITQKPVANLCEEKKFVFDEKEALLMAGTSSDSVQQKNIVSLESGAGIISRRRSVARSSNVSTRGNRRSEMPLLESISESIENSSLHESPPKPPKSRKSTLVHKDFTPRRSLRLARHSEFDTTEDLFNVRPSLCDTPPEVTGTSSTCSTNNITYDFDRLHLESTAGQAAAPQRRMSTRKGKVSLLYTPPQKGRVSTVRKSIKGDLMSFSPDV